MAAMLLSCRLSIQMSCQVDPAPCSDQVVRAWLAAGAWLLQADRHAVIGTHLKIPGHIRIRLTLETMLLHRMVIDQVVGSCSSSKSSAIEVIVTCCEAYGEQ